MSATRPIIIAWPFFRLSDEAATAVFLKNQAELDVLSGVEYIIPVAADATKIAPGDTVRAVDSGRYPGLGNADVPCVFVEGSTDGVEDHFIIPLLDLSAAHIINRMARLKDRVDAGLSFHEIKEKFMSDAAPPPTPEPPGWQKFVMNIITAILVLGVPAYFIATQDIRKGILFFLFVLVVYPIAVGFTRRMDELNRVDLMDLYKVGVKQIPILSGIFEWLAGKVASLRTGKPKAPPAKAATDKTKKKAAPAAAAKPAPAPVSTDDPPKKQGDA